jgi:hypothetical protein
MLNFDESEEDEDEDFSAGDGTADTSAVVACPYCWQQVEITLDPGSGSEQEYEEDCEICCRPWRVQVHFDEDGSATASVDPADES